MNQLLERHDLTSDSDIPVTPGRAWPRPSRRQAAIGVLIALLLLVLVAVAIGGSGGAPGGGSSAGSKSAGANSSTTAGSGGAVYAVPRPAPVRGSAAGGSAAVGAPALGAASGTAGTGSVPAGVPTVVPPAGGAKIVKTGEMDLQVPKGQVPHTLDRLTAIATLQRGYVADSHTAEGADPSGSVTLRVPVSAFEATIVLVRQINAKVLSQQIAGEDVTAKYVDLQARLHSLQATRAAFERLLARATTIGDTLAVQSRITDIQTQIEQLQGELRVLGDQTSFGTLSVSVSERSTASPKPTHRSGMAAAVHRSVDRFVRGIEAIVGILGPILLVLLVAGVGWLLVALGYRVVRRRVV